VLLVKSGQGLLVTVVEYNWTQKKSNWE
jgi:hypothetical protein